MHENAIRQLTAADPILGKLMARVGPCLLEPDGRQTTFQALVVAVAHQQLHGKAARTILDRVRALHPRRAFPNPRDLANTPEDDLRRAGLSRAKVAAVKDIAAKALSGQVPTARQMSGWDDADIVETLTALRGVGRWTAEMLLIFKLGRLDVLPTSDYGVRKGFAMTYRKRDLPDHAALTAHGERWRPYRSIASWYLWRALDSAKSPKQGPN
jgi:3-methyladenine DNA glycosylase/8-oxoguanine DNA glycosylase